jgi:exonuclease III
MYNNNNNNNSVTDKSLLILQFNSNGLKNHLHELETVLNNKRINIDLITETLFTKYSHIYILGYTLIKTNHPDNTAYGGITIFIRLIIVFHPLPSFCQDFLQSCAIELKLKNTIIIVASIYFQVQGHAKNLLYLELTLCELWCWCNYEGDIDR